MSLSCRSVPKKWARLLLALVSCQPAEVAAAAAHGQQLAQLLAESSKAARAATIGERTGEQTAG